MKRSALPLVWGRYGPRASVAYAECAAGDRVERRAVAGTVVGEDALDGDSVAAKESDSAAEEADDRHRFLVAQDLGVGEPAVIVCDVDELPAQVEGPPMVTAA